MDCLQHKDMKRGCTALHFVLADLMTDTAAMKVLPW